MALTLELYWPQPGTATEPTLVHPQFSANGSVWDDTNFRKLSAIGTVICTIAGQSQSTPGDDPWAVTFDLPASTIGNVYTLEARLVVPSSPDIVIQHNFIKIDNGASKDGAVKFEVGEA
jgi:hypothetical protein